MNPNTIKEKYIEDYPNPITLESTEIILNQMKNCVCKIYMDNGIKGTGFFCKIPFPDKDHLIPFLITNNHIIDESYLKKDKRIEFTINNDKMEKKLIISNRRVYTSVKYDITIIEIFESKDDIKNFLELDFDINGEDFNNKYINKSIYTLQYPNSDKVFVSYGIIKAIESTNIYDFRHYCSTDKGSSGSPILNIKTNKLIGIHKGAHNNYNFNKGTLLIYPFKEFISKFKENIQPKPKKIVLKPRRKKVMINKLTISARKRITNEYKEVVEMLDCEGFQIFGLIDNVIYGVLQGPPETSYENGFFKFMITYPNEYPFKPPKFEFKTKIFHPNIYQNGFVTVGILKDCWSPELTLYKIIFCIRSLLYAPDFYGFVNEEAAKLYKGNRLEYEKTLRKYTSEFANFETVQNDLKKLNFKMELGD